MPKSVRFATIDTDTQKVSNSTKIPAFSERLFKLEDSRFALHNVAFGTRIAGTLVLLFSLVDLLAYPDYFWQFLVLRIICVLLIATIGWATRFKWALHHYRLMTMLVPLTPAFFISIFIFIIGEPSTFYYAGLNLCVVGTATLFHRSVATSAVVFAMFLLATLPFLSAMDKNQLPIFLGSCLFIISTSIIAVFGTLNHRRLRRQEFVTRISLKAHQDVLEKKNIELEEALDILNETEGQLFQSEKLAFLGQVSAGIMHEIGNPLTYTNSAVFILEKRLEKNGGLNDDAKEVLADIQDGLNRISGIIRELQEFAHKGKPGGEKYELAESVEAALKILAKPIRSSNTKIETDIDNSLQVVANKNQITQVVSNLILNAIQSMEAQSEPKPRLTISCQANELDPSTVVIEITDNGPGIEEDYLPHIFDPFFTTKDPGQGTGLGLSISYRIIEAHHGVIGVDSEVGKGTTFRVIIPVQNNSIPA